MSVPFFFFAGAFMENKTYYLTYVVGERGVGKTTLLAHFACRYMIPPLSVYDLSICKRKLNGCGLAAGITFHLRRTFNTLYMSLTILS